jgi:uncharacterized membrane protein
MAAEDESAIPDRTLSKSRMEAFSDGVLAIAITLLVLEVAVHPPGSPLEQFLNAWPSYFGYVVSFLTIGAAWIAHHALTDRLDRVDVILLRLNLLFLMVVSFLPFPTRLVADGLEGGRDGERLAAVVYGITLLTIRLLFALMDAYSRRANLVDSRIDDPDLVEERRKFGFVVGAYLVAIVVSLVVPVVAVAFYFAIAVVMVVPFRAVARAFSSPPDAKTVT